jgi:hypothetical protein
MIRCFMEMLISQSSFVVIIMCGNVCCPPLRLPLGPFGLDPAAKRDSAVFGIPPVGEVFKARLPREFGPVERAKLIQQARRSGPDLEGVEVGKPAFEFLDSEEITCEAVGDDEGGMGATPAFPHAREDVASGSHDCRKVA